MEVISPTITIKIVGKQNCPKSKVLHTIKDANNLKLGLGLLEKKYCFTNINLPILFISNLRSLFNLNSKPFLLIQNF